MSRAAVLPERRARHRPRRGAVWLPATPEQGRLEEDAALAESALLDREPADRESDAVTQQKLAPAVPGPPGRTEREERPRTGGDHAPAGAGGGRLTLGDVIAGVWEGLLAAGSAQCPVCREEMRRHGDGGRCSGCGSVLT